MEQFQFRENRDEDEGGGKPFAMEAGQWMACTSLVIVLCGVEELLLYIFVIHFVKLSRMIVVVYVQFLSLLIFRVHLYIRVFVLFVLLIKEVVG